MSKLLTIVMLCCLVFSCRAQEEYVIVGKVLPDGTAELDVSKQVLFRAILSMHRIPEEHFSVWYETRFTEGPKRYLVCEVDTFILGFECRQIGDNIILPAQGITHMGTSEKCLNPGFFFGKEGEIVGCRCEDKLYDGPPRTCNHSIRTPQSDIVSAIEAQQRRED